VDALNSKIRRHIVTRNPMLMAVVLAGAVGVSTVASAQAGGPAAQGARTARVGLSRTSLGRILVTSSGFTLYQFSKDPRNRDTCAKIRECSSTWPALTTSGNPVAGRGVKASLLSTIKLSGGTRQVTYAGHPLYTYAPATERGETFYVGAFQFGGTWDAVNAAGGRVR
jgi:predicted lipoprotein with Yx(FWY)xxD motif